MILTYFDNKKINCLKYFTEKHSIIIMLNTKYVFMHKDNDRAYNWVFMYKCNGVVSDRKYFKIGISSFEPLF